MSYQKESDFKGMILLENKGLCRCVCVSQSVWQGSVIQLFCVVCEWEAKRGLHRGICLKTDLKSDLITTVCQGRKLMPLILLVYKVLDRTKCVYQSYGKTASIFPLPDKAQLLEIAKANAAAMCAKAGVPLPPNLKPAPPPTIEEKVAKKSGGATIEELTEVSQTEFVYILKWIISVMLTLERAKTRIVG